MNRRGFGFLLILLAIVSTAALLVRGMLGPVLDLDALTNDSTLIVVGETVSLNDTGEAKVPFNGSELAVHTLSGLIRVDQVLKGDSPAHGVTFQTYVSDTPVGWRPPGINAYSIFFLRADPQGDLRFTSPYYPAFQVDSGVAASGKIPIEKVVSVIAGIVSSAGAAPIEQRYAIYILSHSKSAAAASALRAAFRNSSGEIQLSVAGALLRRNDITGLEAVKEALLQDPASQLSEVRFNLVVAVSLGLSDPNALPAVRQLTASPDASVRRAAASSLMHMHSPEAIAPLKSLLDDSDFETRFYAVVGLAEAANQSDWRPSMEAFREDEDKYLRHWRNWSQY